MYLNKVLGELSVSSKRKDNLNEQKDAECSDRPSMLDERKKEKG